MFDSIIDHDHYNLVRGNACLVEELQIALLNTLDCSLEHVLRLTVNTNANS